MYSRCEYLPIDDGARDAVLTILASRKCSLKARRALESHKPMSAAKNKIAMRSEEVVARAVKGTRLQDNEPIDVIRVIGGKTHGIEVKTIIDGSNAKITMHKDSLERKLQWARKEKARVHTVAVRGQEVYYRQGVGSFRLSTMTPVERMEDLRSLLEDAR